MGRYESSTFEKYYFEIAGMPVRIYPNWIKERADPLLSVLSDYSWDNTVLLRNTTARRWAPNAGILPECSIWRETANGPHKTSKKIYRFLRCKITGVRTPQKNTALFCVDIEFDSVM